MKRYWISFVIFNSIALLSSCTSTMETKALQNAPTGLTFTTTGDYRIGATDSLLIRVSSQKEMDGTYVVSQSGYISLPLVGSFRVVGMTEKQLAAKLTGSLNSYFKNPMVAVTVSGFDSYKVYISGGVKAGGVFSFKERTTLLQGIAAAGGISEFASGKIIIHRLNSRGKVDKFSADYDDVLEGVDQLNSFILERGDVIHIK